MRAAVTVLIALVLCSGCSRPLRIAGYTTGGVLVATGTVVLLQEPNLYVAVGGGGLLGLGLGLLLGTVIGGAACGDCDVPAPPAEDSPDAELLLALVNDANASMIASAGIAPDIAGAIVEYRDGADGRPGTDDDNLFDSVSELWAVEGVERVTLQVLLARARARSRR